MSKNGVLFLRRTGIALLVLLACSGVWLFSPRLFVLPVAVCVVIAAVLAVVTGRWRALVVLASLLLCFSFLPVDVRFQQGITPYRIVPVVMGLPSPELKEQAKQGEVWLGGCLVNGTEPLWVLLL